MKAYEMGITKEEFVNETKRHQRLDHFINGSYSNGVKGCAVGCAIKSINRLKKTSINTADHSALEEHGICPEWLARVQDVIFEGVYLERSKKWPVEFAEAINTGADLNKIKIPFIVYLLKCNIEGQKRLLLTSNNKPLHQLVIDINNQMIIAQESGSDILISEARSSAESAIRSAAWSTRLLAWSSAESAIRSAVWSAELVARSAGAALRSAVWSASPEAWSAEVFEKYADQLLELIKNCRD